jgi:FixJ family two-component response regulator
MIVHRNASTKPRLTDPGEQPTVFIVEDDADILELIATMLSSVMLQVATCRTAAELLEACAPESAGCLLLDLDLPDMSGLELIQVLSARGCKQPFLVVSGQRDVGAAVQSLRLGAVDFLQKPFNHERLIEGVSKALERDCTWRKMRRQLDALTAREREVVQLLGTGRNTKDIGRLLCISPKTVDVHRAHILKKMGIDSAAELAHALTRYYASRSHDGLAGQSESPPRAG